MVRPVARDDEHPGGASVGLLGHDLAHQRHERGDPGGGRGGGGGHRAGVHIQGSQQGQGAVALVFVLDAGRLAGPGRSSGVAAAELNSRRTYGATH